MFSKVLIANRGEIAVRIVRACRDMGIVAVALYDAADRGSLHVRLADECVQLRTEYGYMDGPEVLRIAREVGAEAIHPGYGFLAEQPAFIEACEQVGIAFVGPPSATVAALQDKIAVLARAEAAGFRVPRHAQSSFDPADLEGMRAAAAHLGYPLVIKSQRGGRGRGTRLVRTPEQLAEAVRRAQVESQAVFGHGQLYLEQAVLPSRYLEVSLLRDADGAAIHLGEHDASIQRNNHKVVEEAPAPYLDAEQRAQLHQHALELARLFGCRGASTVEFVMDSDGQFFFTEIKPRIQVEHPLSEIATGVDIVREQLAIASGAPLRLMQSDIEPRGWAIHCRINAEDPWNRSLPSPGRLQRFQLPGGPGVRVDTYAYTGCDVPVRYDPLLAKLVVVDADRQTCIRRARRALEDITIGGVQTNLPLIQRILGDPDFERGAYTTEFCQRPLLAARAAERNLRDLAVAAAIAYAGRTLALHPTTPERMTSGWHRDSRNLPDYE
ncbi:MAG TPA: biotin carboxylase N-terminal domain-containing protein [Roseiflexaceae bacterium]|nr:biotin carboxylase N-terminal domain-containing protein [Roseiflexaceae bacterium]